MRIIPVVVTLGAYMRLSALHGACGVFISGEYLRLEGDVFRRRFILVPLRDPNPEALLWSDSETELYAKAMSRGFEVFLRREHARLFRDPVVELDQSGKLTIRSKPKIFTPLE